MREPLATAVPYPTSRRSTWERCSSMTVFFTHLPSPVGELLLTGDHEGLLGLFMPGDRDLPPASEPSWLRDDERFADAAAQLREYFAGERTSFELELAPHGTPFQLEVWEALRAIPYGETISYAQLAARVGRPAAVRAVGAANGRNPLSIVVPCHRVIGADGSLTGFSAGLEAKRTLLDLERGALTLT
jgi:methylated-DNA-[protein]-cysteine S-methyltransferase